MKIRTAMLAAVLATAASITGSAFGQAGVAAQGAAKDAAKDASGKAAKKVKAPPAPAVSAQDIAAAKTKGMVWVNLNSGVYHKDGEFYGTTKNGKFMTEADAMKAGHHAAKEPGASKKTKAAKPVMPKTDKK